MGKYVRKLRPNDFWEIGEHESWFSDLAAQGLHLHKIGNTFAYFEKGAPQQMEYRIETSSKKGMSDEQIDFYEENGWDYVTSYTYFDVFSSPKDRGAIEIHTDPAEQANTLKHLNNRLLVNAGVATGLVIYVIAMMYAFWFMDGTPTYVFVRGDNLQVTIMSVLALYVAYLSFRGMRSIQKLRKNLMDGIPINHHAPWRKRYWINRLVSYSVVCLGIVSVALTVMMLVKDDRYTLPKGTTDLLIVRLAQVEQNPNLIREESYHRGVDMLNHVSTKWSPFTLAQYETDESGLIPGEMWGDESAAYSPSMRTQVFELRSSALAKPLAYDLIERFDYEYTMHDYTEMKHPAFDLLLVLDVEEFSKQIVAVKDKIVIFIRYYGEAKKETLIAQLEAKLTEN